MFALSHRVLLFFLSQPYIPPLLRDKSLITTPLAVFKAPQTYNFVASQENVELYRNSGRASAQKEKKRNFGRKGIYMIQ